MNADLISPLLWASAGAAALWTTAAAVAGTLPAAPTARVMRRRTRLLAGLTCDGGRGRAGGAVHRRRAGPGAGAAGRRRSHRRLRHGAPAARAQRVGRCLRRRSGHSGLAGAACDGRTSTARRPVVCRSRGRPARARLGQRDCGAHTVITAMMLLASITAVAALGHALRHSGLAEPALRPARALRLAPRSRVAGSAVLTARSTRPAPPASVRAGWIPGRRAARECSGPPRTSGPASRAAAPCPWAAAPAAARAAAGGRPAARRYPPHGPPASSAGLEHRLGETVEMQRRQRPCPVEVGAAVLQARAVARHQLGVARRPAARRRAGPR